MFPTYKNNITGNVQDVWNNLNGSNIQLALYAWLGNMGSSLKPSNSLSYVSEVYCYGGCPERRCAS